MNLGINCSKILNQKPLFWNSRVSPIADHCNTFWLQCTRDHSVWKWKYYPSPASIVFISPPSTKFGAAQRTWLEQLGTLLTQHEYWKLRGYGVAVEARAKMLSKCNKIMYCLTLFREKYKWIVEPEVWPET